MANPLTSNPLTSIKGIGPALAERMAAAGFDTVPKVADAATDALAQVQGLSEATASKVITAAQSAVPDGLAMMAGSSGGSAASPAPDDRLSRLEARVAELESAVVKARKEAKKAAGRAKAAEKAAARGTKSKKKKNRKKKK